MIGKIEDAIVKRIDDISKDKLLGYQFKTVKTFGQMKEDPQNFINGYPAAWVVFDGTKKVVTQTNVGIQVRGLFYLFVAAKNLRNEKAARSGSDNKAGAYQMGMDMMSIFGNHILIQGETTAIELGNLKPFSVYQADKNNAAIYYLELFVEFAIPFTDPLLDLTSPLEKIHMNWDLPPNGEVGQTALPDDANADATSHITGE